MIFFNGGEVSELQFVIDAYTERRGEPAMLKIHCTNCESHLITYQKDGPGPFLRCYFDRIHPPCREVAPSHFTCSHCNALIGKQGIYEKENRLAYFLVEGSFALDNAG